MSREPLTGSKRLDRAAPAKDRGAAPNPARVLPSTRSIVFIARPLGTSLRSLPIERSMNPFSPFQVGVYVRARKTRRNDLPEHPKSRLTLTAMSEAAAKSEKARASAVACFFHHFGMKELRNVDA